MKFDDDLKLINKMAIPALTSMFGEIVFSVADKAIIGRTSVEGFAGVSVVANSIYMITGTIGILCLAFSIHCGKALGNKDNVKVEKLYNTTMTLAICIGIIFGLTANLFGKAFLIYIYSLEGKTLEHACNYMNIASWGLGLNLIIFIFSAYFRNMKNTTTGMISNITALTINFIVDYTLVFGKFGFPKMGPKGAAIGTVIGLIVGIIIYIYNFIKTSNIEYKFKLYKIELKELWKTYLPLLGQDFVEGTLFVMIITAIVTRLGTYNIATYSILETVSSVIILPAYAYAGVALTLVTQNSESKDRKLLKKYPKLSCICSFVVIILMGLVVINFPQEISKLLTNDAKLVDCASKLFVLIIFVQILNIINQVYKYCLQGVDEETWVFKFSTKISLFSCAIIYLIAYLMGYNLIGVYIGMAITYILLGRGYYKKYNEKIA